MKRILTIQLKIDDSGKPMKPEFAEIDNTSKAMEEFVAGAVEVISIGELAIIMNKNSRNIDLPLNCMLLNENQEVIDGLTGNLLCCRIDLEGDFASIEESDLEVLKKYLIQVYKKEILEWD